MSPECQIANTNFELQKMFRHVLQRSWSRSLATDPLNPVSSLIECRFQPFGRTWPFSIEKLKIFNAKSCRIAFPKKFVKVGNALQKRKQMSKNLNSSMKS